MSNIQRSVAQFLNVPQTSKYLEEILRDKKGDFVSNLIALSESESSLQSCDPARLMKCALNSVAVNLPLNKNLGYAYIIAYKGVPSFQIGYKGWIQLAIRSGQYEFLNAVEIREGEIIRNKLTGEVKFIQENPNGKIVGYLAYQKLISGFQASYYMSVEEVEKHALRYSQAYQSDKKNKTMFSKWSDPEERDKMAKKTVLKSLLTHYGSISLELQDAIKSDNETEHNTIEDVEFKEAEDNKVDLSKL